MDGRKLVHQARQILALLGHQAELHSTWSAIPLKAKGTTMAALQMWSCLCSLTKPSCPPDMAKP